MATIDPFFVADIIGITFFALSGALVATRKKLDLLGLFIASNLTALGGGVLRDLMLDRTPITFTLIYPSLTVLIALLVFIAFRWMRKDELQKRSFFVVSDTIGLIAFSIAGALLALHAGFNLFGVVVLAFTTAVGGGIIRDVMINEVPAVLISDFYGSIAVLIALLMFGLDRADMLSGVSLLFVAIVGVSVRLLAYYRSWRLPIF